MRYPVSIRPAYSRAERVSDAVVHMAGLGAVILAVPALLVVTVSTRGDAAAVTGVAVYGVTLILMLAASAVFNMWERPDWAWLLQRLDHSAIYLKIAGTYTPFTLLTGQGLGLTLGLWGAALAGVGLKVISPARFRWAALSLYLGMGWAGVALGGSFLAALPGPVVWLMLVGGGLYTLGVVFYLWERLPFHNTIWHVFVLAATMVFYAAVILQVTHAPAIALPLP